MIKPPGNRVRCSKCGNTFFVERKEERSKNEANPEYERDHSHSDFVDTGKNFKSKSSTQKEADEKTELKQEALSQEGKEISQESLQSDRESELDIEKTLITNGINWEEFVSITRAKSEEENLDINRVKNMGLEKRGNQSEFNWAKLSIDEDPEESLAEPPKLFDETLEDVKDDTLATPESKRIKQEPEVPIKPRQNILTVDNEKLIITKKESLGSSPYVSNYSSVGIKPQRTSGLAGRIIKKFTYALITLLILTIIIGAGMIILASQGLIPQEKVNGISKSILSKLPVNFTEAPGKDIIVSDLLGRWVSTRSGLVYVVSGNITNQSKYVVNYLKLKSEFISDGKSLFEQLVYAGNTFTENELQSLPTEAMIQKLNRKNGDINFDNPNKLAGLNFGIEPGESVPFFTIFPSESRILGLKYKISVSGFERAQ